MFGSKAIDKHYDWILRTEAELRAAFSIGQEFSYLGRTCVVTGHSVYNGDYWSPKLCCDYADNLGVIRHIYFTPDEALALAQRAQTV